MASHEDTLTGAKTFYSLIFWWEPETDVEWSLLPLPIFFKKMINLCTKWRSMPTKNKDYKHSPCSEQIWLLLLLDEDLPSWSLSGALETIKGNKCRRDLTWSCFHQGKVQGNKGCSQRNRKKLTNREGWGK